MPRSRNTRKRKPPRKKSKRSDVRERSKSLRRNPSGAPKYTLQPVASPFPSGLSREERLSLVRQIGRTAKDSFNDQLIKLKQWFHEFDSLYILSVGAFYFQLFFDGYDPEAHGRLEIPHYCQELLQAFALTGERTITVKPLLDKGNEFKDDMATFADSMKYLWLDLPEGVSEKDLLEHKVLWSVRTQTAVIRNSAYLTQTKHQLENILGLIESPFREVWQVTPCQLLTLLFHVFEKTNENINKHWNAMRTIFKGNNCRRIITRYHENFGDLYPISEKDIQQILTQCGNDAKSLKYMFIAHSDLRLSEIYSHTLEDLLPSSDDQLLGSMEQIFRTWSLEFASLSNHNINWFILDNPVLKQPFIRLEEGKYYSSILGVIPHLLFPMFEILMTKSPNLLQEYFKTRSKYLEDKAHFLFLNAFPNGEVWHNLDWSDDNQSKYETDLLVRLDNALLVIECKSGTYTGKAKRGAKESLRTKIEELILEPSMQANRLIEYIKSTPSVKYLRTKDGGRCEIDPSNIQHYIPIALSFESLGFIATDCKTLIQSGFLPGRAEDIALSICLTDMEMVLELLDAEVEVIHYMKRRRELEQRVDYEGDEADLLAFYLKSGFNLGDSEFNPNFSMNLVIMSKELDPFFVARDNGIDTPKPSLDKTVWWRDILTVLIERKPSRWLDIGMALLSLSKVEQETFEKEFRKMANRVKHGMAKQKYNWVVGRVGATKQPQFVFGFPHRIDNKEERFEMINGILSSDETEYYPGAVVIAIHVDRGDYPYGTIAFDAERSEDAFRQ